MAAPAIDDGETRPPSRFAGAVEAKVVAALARGACLSAPQIAERVGTTTRSVNAVLNRLLKAGKVTAWKAHPKDRVHLWASEE